MIDCSVCKISTGKFLCTMPSPCSIQFFSWEMADWKTSSCPLWFLCCVSTSCLNFVFMASSCSLKILTSSSTASDTLAWASYIWAMLLFINSVCLLTRLSRTETCAFAFPTTSVIWFLHSPAAPSISTKAWPLWFTSPHFTQTQTLQPWQ